MGVGVAKTQSTLLICIVQKIIIIIIDKTSVLKFGCKVYNKWRNFIEKKKKKKDPSEAAALRRSK